MNRLTGKVAVITGGAGAIGKAAGKRFVSEGACVLLTDLDDAALEEACAEIGGDTVSYFAGDVTRARDNLALVEAATERYGGLDTFVANAGIEGVVAPLELSDEADFDRVMAVNVKGPFLGLKAAIPALAARGGGSIIITSSVAGLGGGASLAPYVTSKHAVVGLMKSAALELAAQNIRVNTVNPSPVEGRMMRSLEEGLAPVATKRDLEAMIPLGRYAQPDDVANLMLFLASDESAFITGAVYLVDGGTVA